MKILTLTQTSCRHTDTVFGVSRSNAAAAFLMASGLFIAATYIFVVGRVGVIELPRPWAAFAGIFFLLLVAVTHHTWRAAWRPTNWVMRLQGNDILIKFRSFENWPMSQDDPQVILLHRNEIKFARKSLIRQIERSMDNHGVQATTRTYLEICLKNSDTSSLEKSLADEAARPGYGNDRHQTRWCDTPVDVVVPGTIRIIWRGGPSRVHPSIQSALDALGQMATLDEPQKSVDAFTPAALGQLAQDEQKKKLRELAGRNPIQAAQVARELYGCSLAQAMQIIEDFRSDPTTPSAAPVNPDAVKSTEHSHPDP